MRRVQPEREGKSCWECGQQSPDDHLHNPMSENNKSENHPTNIFGPGYKNFMCVSRSETNTISHFVAEFVKPNYEKYE